MPVICAQIKKPPAVNWRLQWVARGKPPKGKVDRGKADALMTVYLQKKTWGRRQVQMHLMRQYGIHMSLGSVHR